MKKSAIMILAAGFVMWMTAGVFGQDTPVPPQTPAEAPPPADNSLALPAVAWDCPLGNEPVGIGRRAQRPARGEFPRQGRGVGMRSGGRNLQGIGRGMSLRDGRGVDRGMGMLDGRGIGRGGRGMQMNRPGRECLRECPNSYNIGPGRTGQALGQGRGAGRGLMRMQPDALNFGGGRQFAAPGLRGGRGAGRGIGRGIGDQFAPMRQGRGLLRDGMGQRGRTGDNLSTRKQLRDESCLNQDQKAVQQERLELRIEQLKARLHELEIRLEETR